MPRKISEEFTRKEMIDPQLEQAGWFLADLSKVKTDIPIPPLGLQEEFASMVRRVESLRGRMAESERQVEGLFESLLSEVFVHYQDFQR